MSEGGYLPVDASGSTKGANIAVVATSSPGTTLHDTGTSAKIQDLVTVEACNIDTRAHKLTIQWGGTASADEIIQWIKPESGLEMVVELQRLSGTGVAAASIKAYADTTNIINCKVRVMRMTP